VNNLFLTFPISRPPVLSGAVISNRTGVVLAIVLSLSIPGWMPVARAQDVEQQAEEAADDLERAYSVVDDAVANRDAIEDMLFEALNSYEQAAESLARANADLDRIAQSLVFAEAQASDAESSLDTQAAAAYMEAVSAIPTVVLDTGSVEHALIVDRVFRSSQEETLGRLDELLVMRRELDAIRVRFQENRDEVETLTVELDEEADQLADLFSQANEEVAAAFEEARAAEVEYRLALDAVDQARAAEEERRRQEEAARAATATTTTAPSATNTTLAEAATEEWPPIPISSRTMSWKPLTEVHFQSDLVLDALVIMQCESDGDPEAVNPYSGAAGLFQFLPGTWAVASVQAGVGDRSVFDGEANIIAASWLAEYYRSRGYDPWRPWSCRTYL